MTRRYAILLDGGFVTKRLGKRLGRQPNAPEVMQECARISTHPDLAPLTLLRIYFYDAPPAKGNIKNPWGTQTNLGQTAVHAQKTAFLDTLELQPNVALRKGELSVHGWKVKRKALQDIVKLKRTITQQDLVPDMQQKGVDLRIGLDIARLSLQHLVDTLVVVTGDSDMVPAFKFARREGIRIYLDHLGGPVKRDLKAHVDVII
jgi:uncharacterized LabA/DUF88 family protein